MHNYNPEEAHRRAERQQGDFSLSLTVENARAHIESYMQHIPAYTHAYEGRGVVICAGGRYFPSAWVGIHMLRLLGCTLPIQIWYLSRQEFDPIMQELVRPLGVECIDASQTRRQFPSRLLNGWELKPYAILHSPFREVLFLDADSTPLQNPEHLFSTAAYQESGAIFWPDIAGGDLNPDAQIWDICGIPYQAEPAFESGQIIIDKKRCWRELCLSMWFNEHSDFFYNYIYGDKDTFHMAFRKFEYSYAMPKKRLLQQSGTLVQYNFAGEALFQHGKKWRYDEQSKSLEGIFYDQECLTFIKRLQQQWSGQIQPCIAQYPKSEREKQAIGNLGEKLFLFLTYGSSRLVSFKPDGSLGNGRDAQMTSWDIAENNNGIYLYLFSTSTLVYVLQNDENGHWIGHETDKEGRSVQLRFLYALPQSS